MEIDSLFETFFDQYRSLSALVQRLPIAIDMKSVITTRLHEGALWTKEALQIVKMSNEQKPSEIAPEVDSNIVNDNNASTA